MHALMREQYAKIGIEQDVLGHATEYPFSQPVMTIGPGHPKIAFAIQQFGVQVAGLKSFGPHGHRRGPNVMLAQPGGHIPDVRLRSRCLVLGRDL